MSQDTQSLTMPRYRHAVYWIGDIVYQRICEEPTKGIVTGVIVRVTGLVYLITWASGCESSHYDFELSTEFVPDYPQQE